MAQGNRTSFFLGLSALAYFLILFAPLALVGQAQAQSEQDPLQENYGTGKLFIALQRRRHVAYRLRQLLVSIWALPTPA